MNTCQTSTKPGGILVTYLGSHHGRKYEALQLKKNSNYIEHDNLKSIPALAPETIDQSSKTRVSGVPCFGFPTSIMEGL